VIQRIKLLGTVASGPIDSAILDRMNEPGRMRANGAPIDNASWQVPGKPTFQIFEH
jgi:hypothetical protein